MNITNQLQILLVEDDEVDSEIISRALKKTSLDFNLAIASSIEKALHLLKQKNFDICLTDLHLGMDTGIDLIKKTRKLGLNCPFIVLTGLSSETTAQESIYADADDYLAKDEISNRSIQRSILHSIARRQTFNRSHHLQTQYNKLQRLSSLGEMAISIAHEINNPLTGILGHITLVKSKLNKLDIDNEAYQSIFRHLESLEKLSLSIDSTIKNTKNLFKQSVTGNNKTPLSLRYLIDTALDGLQFHPQRQSVRITVDCPDDIEILCVANDIIQVISNLVTNSCNAIFEQKEKWVNIKAALDSHQNTTIQISDSGTRPESKFCEEMVNKFVTTSESGLGIGLSIVHRIVTKLNGSISIDADKTNTTFDIVIPYQAEENLNSSYSILVVEDNHDLNEYLCEKLQESGFHAHPCLGGKEAFNAYKSHKFDMVITDVSMPEGTGTDLYLNIKNHAEQQNASIVPFIFTTGNLSLKIDVPSKHSVQLKPYDVSELTDLVTKFLYQSAA